MRSEYCIVEFNNGNLDIKYDDETITSALLDRWGVLADILWNLDCEFVGEPQSFGNFDVAIMIYNSHLDRIYTFSGSDMEDLLKGKSVRLLAVVPDEEARQYIAEHE